MESPASNYLWQGKVILVGEDELINFRLLQVMLAKTGVTLIHAKTGIEVLDLLNNSPKIDLILLDIKMPGMDGIEVTIEIRKKQIHLPIIIQTAFTMEEERLKSLHAGCNAFLTKPIKQTELLLILDPFLITDDGRRI